MTLYLVIPLLVVVALLQATIIPHLVIWGVYPNLPLLVVVSWSLLRGAREGMVWGAIAGVAVDLLSGAPLGAATLGMLAASLLSGLGHATVYRAHAALPLLVTFLVTIVYDLVFLLVVRISGQAVDWLPSLVQVILPSALFNALLIPIVLWGMRFLDNRFGREEMEW